VRINGFVVGLVCSPVIFVIYWLVGSWLPQASEPVLTDSEATLTLFDINYTPASSRKVVPDTSFQWVALEGTDKKAVDLKQNLGKPVILHFWAPWCGTCLVEMPYMEAFAKKHGKNVTIICVANDHTGGQSSRDYYQNNNIQRLSLNIDQHEGQLGRLGRALQIQGFPTTILISAKGEEMGRIIGPVDWQGKAGELLLNLLKAPATA
jgi:thiol-disulfide isomerase/thioredoxin